MRARTFRPGSDRRKRGRWVWRGWAWKEERERCPLADARGRKTFPGERLSRLWMLKGVRGIPRDPWIVGGMCTAGAGCVGGGMGCRGIGQTVMVRRVVGASVGGAWCMEKGAGIEAGGGKSPCKLAFGYLVVDCFVGADGVCC